MTTAAEASIARGGAGYGLLALLLVWLVASTRADPPAPVPAASAGDTDFSAERALAHVRRLDPQQTPHPVGSRAHAEVRNRLLEAMRSLGLQPSVQSTWACRPGAACAPVHNVVARIPGRTDGPALMLAAHYDSVHAGPGAGDDLHAVGILLEIGRMLLAGEPPQGPVILLVTDAEEVGLLGARAFVREHPWASDVAVVINAEARGTSGRSNMFETSEGNAGLVEAVATVPSPTATSLAYEIYRRMPNDTDLTVFKAAGMEGLNFAFVGGVSHYHTPLDDLLHLSAASVQHQGESVWAVTRALASADLGALNDDADAVYVDLLGWVLLRAPVRAVLPVGALLLLGSIVVALRLRRREMAAVGAVPWGALAALSVLVSSLVVVVAVDAAIAALGDGTSPWPADPTPRRLALLLGIGLAADLILRAVARRTGPVGTASGVWLVWTVLALLLAIALPGAAPLFLLPAAAGLVALVVLLRVRASALRDAVVLVLPVVVTATVWLPIALGLEQSLGFSPAVATMLPYVLVATALAPDRVAMLAGTPRPRWPLAVAALALVGLVVVAGRVDAYDEDRPRRLIVDHHTDVDAEQAQLRAGPATEPLPESMRAAATFAASADSRIPLGPSAFTAPAPVLDAPAPTIDVIEETRTADGRALSVRIRSPRGADRAIVLFPAEADLRGLDVEGQPLDVAADLPARWEDRRGLAIFGLPDGGARVELRVGPDPFDIELVDVSPRLSEPAAALAASRPAWAVTSQWGDTTSMTVRRRL